MPQLQCEVYDYIFSGMINPTLGIFLINIRKLIIETNRQIEEDEKITRVKLGYYLSKGVVSNSPGDLADLDKLSNNNGENGNNNIEINEDEILS
jgi:hypothetical protein